MGTPRVVGDLCWTVLLFVPTYGSNSPIARRLVARSSASARTQRPISKPSKTAFPSEACRRRGFLGSISFKLSPPRGATAPY